MARVFISYRREDSSGYAGRLFDHLEDRFGKPNVFMDIDSLRLGVDFVEVIDSNVSSCDVLLAIIGKNWLSAKDEEGGARLDDSEDFVRLEICAALNRGIHVIPVLVGGARMPRAMDLPHELAGLARLHARIIHDDGFRAGIEWLIGDIEAETARKAEEERRSREAAEAARKEEQKRQRREAAEAARKEEQERQRREAAEAARKEEQERQRREAALVEDERIERETAATLLRTSPQHLYLVQKQPIKEARTILWSASTSRPEDRTQVDRETSNKRSQQ